jgi:hypothetical protein
VSYNTAAARARPRYRSRTRLVERTAATPAHPTYTPAQPPLLTRTARGGARTAPRRARGYAQGGAPLTVGIRREDAARIWERRAPLTPGAVRALVRDERVRVLVQPCARRVFPLAEFLAVRSQLSAFNERAC